MAQCSRSGCEKEHGEFKPSCARTDCPALMNGLDMALIPVPVSEISKTVSDAAETGGGVLGSLFDL